MAKWAIKSDIGVVRLQNQDRGAVFKKDQIIFALICDGMGGHQGGEIASTLTIDVFDKEFQTTFPQDHNYQTILKWFSKTLEKVRKTMIKHANHQKPLLDMGTTLAGAIILQDQIFVYNVGDSRVYIYNGILQQITRDHNIRNHYIKMGYTEEQAAMTVGASALTSAVGPNKRTSLEVFIVKDPMIEYVILTTDGIHDYISKPKFETILATNQTLDQKLESMIKNAIVGKSSDNLTGIIVCLKEGLRC